MKVRFILLVSVLASLSLYAQEQVTYTVDGQKIKLTVSQNYRAVQAVNLNEDVLNRLLDRTRAKEEDITNIASPKTDTVSYVIVDISGKKSNQKKAFDQRLGSAINALSTEETSLDKLPVLTNGKNLRLLPNEFVLCFQKDVTREQKDAYFNTNKIRVLRQSPYEPNEFIVTYENVEPLEAIRKTESPDKLIIKYITPNFIDILPKSVDMQTETTPYSAVFYDRPDDELMESQWYLPRIGLLGQNETEPSCWTITKGDSIIIAILDEGVDITHDDLKDKIKDPFDIVYNDNDQQPDSLSYHGTACAGIAAATTNNGKGVSGIASNSLIMPVRIAVKGADGWEICRVEDVANGIRYAANHGARVFNCSWGGGGESDPVNAAIDDAIEKKCVLVFAAGNNGQNYVEYPASLSLRKDVIAVSAVNESDELKVRTQRGNWGSQYGDEITLCAPGVNIFTTMTTRRGYSQYGYFNGTSSAAPIVSGAVALMLSVNPSLTPAQVKQIIRGNCDKLSADEFDPRFGYGRLNVRKLIKAAKEFGMPQSGITPAGAQAQTEAGAVQADTTRSSEQHTSTFGPLNAPPQDVYHFITPLKQPKTAACWITAATIVHRYHKNNHALKIEDVLPTLGSPFDIYFETNSGLPGADKEKFYNKAGFAYDHPQNYTIQAWFNLLKNKGPLVVDRLSFQQGNMIWTHVVVVVGIKIDSTDPNNSKFTYIDPWTGKEEPPITFLKFLEKYEALPANQVTTIQVSYFK